MEDIVKDKSLKRSKKQRDTLAMMKDINEYEAGRAFIQTELPGVTLHTLRALELKGYIESFEGPQVNRPLKYYRLVK